MSPKLEEIAALEQFFNSITLPKELQLNKAIKYIDLPFFVNTKLRLLKEGKYGESDAKLRYDDLVDIKKLLEKSGDKFV